MAPHRGHKHDAARSSEPPYISEPLPIQAIRWLPWTRPEESSLCSLSGGTTRPSSAGTLLSHSALETAFGSYSRTYDYSSGEKAGASHSRRRSLLVVFTENPWVPGAMRIVMMLLSCVTLGLGAKLTTLNTHLAPLERERERERQWEQQLQPWPWPVREDETLTDFFLPICAASPILAVILAACAILYLPYIFYDEYFGGPVGVRTSPLAKARLLFFDLTFVVLYAVDVTLAASEAFTSGCTDSYMLERAVFALVLLTLVAWIATFSITLVRLIVRIGANYRR